MKSTIFPTNLTTEELLVLLETGRDGLSEREVESHLAICGPNRMASEEVVCWPRQLAAAFQNPFMAVLALLSLVSAAMQDVKTVAVLGTMMGLSGLLRFVTEFRSNRAAQALQNLVQITATVVRAGSEREVPLAMLVPGDIVRLRAGDMIPADLRVLSCKDLFVSQSSLTGESYPVEKSAVCGSGVAPLERSDTLFMGSNVVSGVALGLVVATGDRTVFGSLARGLAGKRPLTSFDRGVSQVSWLLIRFMAVMVPVVFLLNGLTKGDWVEAALFALSVAVGLTPEMLPMVVTANLAKGAFAMARRRCIVKRLNAIQNLGAMDVLCTDKTGTLTMDKIVLERYVDCHGEPSHEVLRLAYLNSLHQTGLKNLLDEAVLRHAGEFPQDPMVKIDEIPFDFERRRMSVVLQSGPREQLLICKGAVEELLAVSTLDEAKRARLMALVHGLNAEGLRVVAVASRVFQESSSYGVAQEKDLTLAGFVAFLDPPKPSAAGALAALGEHGVDVKVLTGDNDAVTRKVCRDLGLAADRVVLGSDLDGLDDIALGDVVARESIFAKLTPAHKSRIVLALQAAGRTVGFLGDGINDAGALRNADVGISVDSATDIAKESADIIMLEKDLMALEEGILEGRNTFGNIIKYIKMTASSNFGNVFSVLIASAFLPFLPMLPIQLLVQNLLYDFSQTSIPADRVDEEYLRTPRRWYAGDIGRFMLCVGPISSVFDVVTFALLWWVLGAHRASLFQSGWFVEGLLSQTLIVHMIRTEKVPFLESRATWPVVLATLLVMAAGLVLPFTGLGDSLGLVGLPPLYFGLLVVTLVGYCALTQSVKRMYLRRFGKWL